MERMKMRRQIAKVSSEAKAAAPYLQAKLNANPKLRTRYFLAETEARNRYNALAEFHHPGASKLVAAFRRMRETPRVRASALEAVIRELKKTDLEAPAIFASAPTAAYHLSPVMKVRAVSGDAFWGAKAQRTGGRPR